MKNGNQVLFFAHAIGFFYFASFYPVGFLATGNFDDKVLNVSINSDNDFIFHMELSRPFPTIIIIPLNLMECCL